MYPTKPHQFSRWLRGERTRLRLSRAEVAEEAGVEPGVILGVEAETESSNSSLRAKIAFAVATLERRGV